MKKSNLYKAIKFHFEDQYEQINTQIYGKINHDLIQNSPEWRGIWENLYGSEEEKFNSIHPIILKEEYDISIVDEKTKKFHKDLIIIPAYIAKGLEFDSVLVYNNRENTYRKNERNLLYVACTRAQHELCIYN